MLSRVAAVVAVATLLLALDPVAPDWPSAPPTDEPQAEEGLGRQEAAPSETAAEGRARKELELTIRALGGFERLRSIHSLYVSGRGRENLSAESQGLAPDAPTWRPHEERVAVDANRLRVAWERRTPRNDQSLRWRRFVYAADSSGFYDWNAGMGRMRAAASSEASRRAIARRIPHLLVLEAATRATRRVAGPDQEIDGAPVWPMEVTLEGGDSLTLYFWVLPVVLRRARYHVNLPGSGEVAVDWDWPDWRKDARLGWVPTRHQVSVAGVPFQEVRYSGFAADSSAAESLLTIPADAPPSAEAMRAPPPAPDRPALGVVAPGVHVLRLGAFTVMFVEFRDFVVAMEAPENHPGLEAIPAACDTTPVTSAFLAAIRAAAPGKPIRFAILSHHHSDHMGGAREFAAAGATLLVAPGHRAAARKAAGETARIETIASRRSITDGTRTLEVFNVGRNPHTNENLFAWLPAERVLFQGDLFYYQRGAEFPPAGRETMNRFFARWLSVHHLAPLAIYGVHNDGPAGEAQLAAMRR